MRTQDIQDVLELSEILADNGYESAGNDPEVLAALFEWRGGTNGASHAVAPAPAPATKPVAKPIRAKEPTKRAAAPATALPDPPDEPDF